MNSGGCSENELLQKQGRCDDVVQKIKSELSKSVVLFMKGTPDFHSGFSAQTVAALRASGRTSSM
jgi:glutaredoxin-related protein